MNKYMYRTKWKQSGNKNLKVGQEWEQSGSKVGARTSKWDKNGNKVGTRNSKWDKNKVGTKWEQDPQSGTRMGTKWEQNAQNISGTKTAINTSSPSGGSQNSCAPSMWKMILAKSKGFLGHSDCRETWRGSGFTHIFELSAVKRRAALKARPAYKP